MLPRSRFPRCCLSIPNSQIQFSINRYRSCHTEALYSLVYPPAAGFPLEGPFPKGYPDSASRLAATPHTAAAHCPKQHHETSDLLEMCSSTDMSPTTTGRVNATGHDDATVPKQKAFRSAPFSLHGAVVGHVGLLRGRLSKNSSEFDAWFCGALSQVRSRC